MTLSIHQTRNSNSLPKSPPHMSTNSGFFHNHYPPNRATFR